MAHHAPTFEPRARLGPRTALTELVALLAALGPGPRGQYDSQDLAKQLANPIANLVSVPFQFNFDGSTGPRDRERLTFKIQPVVPTDLTRIG
jgi:hypothetical protein